MEGGGGVFGRNCPATLLLGWSALVGAGSRHHDERERQCVGCEAYRDLSTSEQRIV